MMDLLVCGAPLDNSFHKDKLELVNKGSLGRRRKPTRSNLKQFLSQSNHFPAHTPPSNHIPSKTPPPNRVSPKTSTPLPQPVNSVKKCVTNGNIHTEREGLQNFKPPSRIESSLPRTLAEPNHVNDAHQFTIEAKLKRKKSDVGRSAVLIQTWERRSRSDSFSKRLQAAAKTAARNSTCNRFQNKENLRDSATMPDSYASSKSVESLKNGGLVSRVRDAYCDETIIYRMSENGPRYIKPVQMNGRQAKMNGQEPEWISLSRKLCAKFVEGHIVEHNSADSYLHEEPDGAKQQQQVAASSPPQQHRRQHQQLTHQRPAEKKKKVMETEIPNNQNGEPPWIHLSRKLCTKFIEEHIEYPVVVQEESKKEAVAVEPNGDVRIIEKVGQPRGRKSKIRKESEPEWVSLSRKLRAKFIESHIDDPDTISLDNQLNASDPEETSSDSMPDISLEMVVQKKVYQIPIETHLNGYKTRGSETSAYSVPQPNRRPNNQNTLLFPEKECCWEYQEMEFDQESNSGTFQESEFYEEPPPNSIQKTRVVETRNDSFPHVSQEPQVFQNECVNHIRPTQTTNPHFFNNAECYNNDVSFAPHTTVPDKPGDSYSDCEKKAITVQFISHRENVSRVAEQSIQKYKNQVPDKPDNSSFFNLTTWEEAHYESDHNDSEGNSNPHNTNLRKELRSKSMDNICDSTHSFSDGTTGKSVQELKQKIDNSVLLKSNSIYKSEEFLDKMESKAPIETENSKHGRNVVEISTVSSSKSDTSCSRDNGFDVNEIAIHDLINSKLKGSRSECSKTSQTDLHLICNDFQSTIFNGHGDMETATLNGFVNSKHRALRPECSKTSQTDLHLICSDHQCTEDLVSYVNGKFVVSDTNGLKGFEDKENSKEFLKRSPNSSCSSSNADDCSRTTISNGEGKSKNSVPNDSKNSRFREERNDVRNTSQNDSNSKNHGCQNNEKKIMIGKGKKNQYENSVPSRPEEQNSTNTQKGNEMSGMKKHFKCNGTIPNSSNLKSKPSQVQDNKKEIKITNVSQPKKIPLPDEIMNASKQGDAPVTNEYANIQSSLIKERGDLECESNLKRKSHSVHSVFHEIPTERSRHGDSKSKSISRNHSSGMFPNGHVEDTYPEESHKIIDDSCHGGNDANREISRIKIKSKSLHDISQDFSNNQSSDDDSFKRETKQNGDVNGMTKSKISPVKFQEFEFPNDIPLCAKLVSKQNGKPFTPSVSSSYNRNTSPGSESSHVYEDMFKETTSCPSDSEASSWTVMKNNSYYVNGRSSSMNDLDFSDSCSMSVKCDYASSCSEQSTLQSRHSSCNSSSFYVNLRDYDQHMLEPSLSRKKKNHKVASNGNTTKVNSNPPTPESLRHLFTSPLSSIHSPANRTARLVNRLPNEPESHYYSTAAAASSAFKHGFDPTPPKPKKTERSSSIKIKDIAHGIILTFRRFQNHSKSAHVSPTHYVDVSHLAESGSKADLGKSKSKKEHKDASRKKDDKNRWGFPSENGKTDSDSGCPMPPPTSGHKAKARRSSSDLTGKKPSGEVSNGDMQSNNIAVPEKKKSKNGKKNSNARDKKKTRSKSLEPRTIPTVSRKVQQMADGTLYLVTTVSGDTTLPGVYSDSPDTSSELSTHKPVKMTGESNC